MIDYSKDETALHTFALELARELGEALQTVFTVIPPAMDQVHTPGPWYSYPWSIAIKGPDGQGFRIADQKRNGKYTVTGIYPYVNGDEVSQPWENGTRRIRPELGTAATTKPAAVARRLANAFWPHYQACYAECLKTMAEEAESKQSVIALAQDLAHILRGLVTNIRSGGETYPYVELCIDETHTIMVFNPNDGPTPIRLPQMDVTPQQAAAMIKAWHENK